MDKRKYYYLQEHIIPQGHSPIKDWEQEDKVKYYEIKEKRRSYLSGREDSRQAYYFLLSFTIFFVLFGLFGIYSDNANNFDTGVACLIMGYGTLYGATIFQLNAQSIDKDLKNLWSDYIGLVNKYYIEKDS